jgi:hypothetical protein
MKDLIRDVIGGTPAEVGGKILVSALVVLWDYLRTKWAI